MSTELEEQTAYLSLENFQMTFYFAFWQTYQVKKKGVGLVEEKQVILHEEGRMDDGVTFSR